MEQFDLFLDESCYLEHDQSDVMSIGFLKVPDKDYSSLKKDLKEIKLKYKLPYEIKWNSCSNTKRQFYFDLIDYFFESSLSFRTIVVKYKKRLNHEEFNQGSHDNFYYKLIFFLLTNDYFNPSSNLYRVFLDIKDTRGREKLHKITEVLRNSYSNNSPFIHFQHIRSHESVFIQLADLFIGAVTYKSRGIHLVENASPIKKEIIEYIEAKSGYQLDEGTEPWETKFNIFDHQPRKKFGNG